MLTDLFSIFPPMPLLLLIFLILNSCSSNLIYNEPTPNLLVEAGFYRVPDDKILRNSDTILLNSSGRFQASIKPLSIDAKNYYWYINSQKHSYLTVRRTFDSLGIYTAEFYVIDYLNDTLVINSTVIVSSEPACEQKINLEIFQGSSIFSWNCRDKDPNEKLTYNFKLINSDNKRTIDTTLQDTVLQFGFALPENFEAHLTASNRYFKTELDSIWSESDESE